MLVCRKELSRLSENQAGLNRNKFNLQLKVERSSRCRPKPSNSSPENQRITYISFPVQPGWGTDSKTKAWTCGKPFIWKLKALFGNVDGARVPKRRPEHVENPSYESYRLGFSSSEHPKVEGSSRCRLKLLLWVSLSHFASLWASWILLCISESLGEWIHGSIFQYIFHTMNFPIVVDHILVESYIDVGTAVYSV